MTTLTPTRAPAITMTPATTADLLNAAADYLVEHGWCQNIMRSSTGRVCLWGAICAVGPSHGTSVDLLDAVHLHLQWNPIDWNDQPVREAREVITVLRRTAEGLR